MHPWNEPIKRVIAKAATIDIKVHTPMIGEPLFFNRPFESKSWREI